jgi:iron(III) transport system substrate-binding protein
MKTRAKLATATIAVAMALSGTALAQKTRLTVYTAMEPDQLEVMKKAAEAGAPGIEIAWVRDSTGVVTARLLAEKENPRADVVWGLSASSMAIFDQQGMLLPLHAQGRRDAEEGIPQRQGPRDLDRPGRLSLGRLLQHDRGGEGEGGEARLLDRSRQA